MLAAGGAALLGACTAPGDGTPGVSGTSSGGPDTASRPSATVPVAATPTGSGGAGWVRAENARAGTRAWRIDKAHRASDMQLAGYTDRVSVVPGESFGLHLSSALGPVTVRAYRLGYYGGTGARQVWVSPVVAAGRQPPPSIDALRTVRCDWPVALRVDTTGWPEGSYLLRLEAGGRAAYVPVVLRSRTLPGRLVLVSAVTCHQAYNTWGGYSLYQGRTGAANAPTRSRSIVPLTAAARPWCSPTSRACSSSRRASTSTWPT